MNFFFMGTEVHIIEGQICIKGNFKLFCSPHIFCIQKPIYKLGEESCAKKAI